MDIRDTDRLTTLQRSWDALGAIDPMWAILSDPAKLGRGWDETEFFATGVDEISHLIARLKHYGMTVTGERALDFGCGVGRLTQALAAYFASVTGVDIAPSMIARARELNKLGARCNFVVNDRSTLQIFPDAHFNLVYSAIVLQHLDSELGKKYIAEFIRVVAPGGSIVFQLTEPAPHKLLPRLVHFFIPLLLRIVPMPILRAYRKAKYRTAPADMVNALPRFIMEMHGTRRADICALVRAAGATVVAVEENKRAGEAFKSWQYYLRV